jgi:hypothetical protein
MQWWILLEPLIVAFIERCTENRSQADIENGMLNPGIVEESAMNQLLHDEGYRGRQRKRRVRQGMRKLRRAKQEEVHALVVKACGTPPAG